MSTLSDWFSARVPAIWPHLWSYWSASARGGPDRNDPFPSRILLFEKIAHLVVGFCFPGRRKDVKKLAVFGTSLISLNQICSGTTMRSIKGETAGRLDCRRVRRSRKERLSAYTNLLENGSCPPLEYCIHDMALQPASGVKFE